MLYARSQAKARVGSIELKPEKRRPNAENSSCAMTTSVLAAELTFLEQALRPARMAGLLARG